MLYQHEYEYPINGTDKEYASKRMSDRTTFNAP